MLDKINKIIWAVAIAMIFLNAIYFSVRLKFPQLRIRKIISSLKSKETTDTISAKDTLIMSLASKIGAGSLAGVAFAIFYGGPGTIFWMWISSILVSINCYVENVLSTKYKEKDGEFYKGGPSYYIKKGLGKKYLGLLYSIIAIMAYIFGFLTIQNNTITVLINHIYPINKIIISLIISVLSFLIIVKGIKAISNICNKIVPIMAIIYLSVGIIVIVLNIDIIPDVLLSIIKGAFTSKALSGGLIYTFLIGMQKGIFANEAGVGTSAIISGATSNKDAQKQGYMGIIETYFISLFITTITALIILTSNYLNLNLTEVNGIEITNNAFVYHLGNFGQVILLVVLILFAFSTIITAYYYGESNLKSITKNKILIPILKVIAFLTIFLGGIIPSSKAWNIVDLFVATLAIINIYAIYKLREEVLIK